MLTSSVGFYDTHLRPISQEMLKISIRKMSLKYALAKLFHPSAGAIELNLYFTRRENLVSGWHVDLLTSPMYKAVDHVMMRYIKPRWDTDCS